MDRNKKIKLAAIFVSLFLATIFIELVSFTYIQLNKANTQEILAWKGYLAHVEDPIYSHILKSGYRDEKFQINADGIRSSMRSVKDDCQSKKAILFLGDSMVYGFAIKQESIFSEILARKLAGFCFINAGVSGYSPAHYNILYSRWAEKIELYATVVFYTEANDLLALGMYEPGPRFDLDGSDLYLVPAGGNVSPPWSILDRIFTETNFGRLLDQLILKGRDFTWLYYRVQLFIQEDDFHAWKIVRAIFTDIQKESDKRGSKVLFVDVPTQNQLRGMSGTQRQDMFRRFSDENGLAYIDLMDEYPEPYAKIFLENDSHWNEDGHELIAGLVEKEIPKFETRISGLTGLD